ncbi:hypothetical protein [Mucilaginibacter sp.]|uniref:DUF6984 family protein n=1 Tax=Mucilaginibacter sp. TaxID=1882438 RepID=UPI0032679463
MRLLKKEEIDLISHLLKQVPNCDHFLQKLADLQVEEMKDGKMGSLKFIPKISKKQTMKAEIARIDTLTDFDGVLLSITLNLSTDNELYELDIFKGDFSPLKQFPLPPYE